MHLDLGKKFYTLLTYDFFVMQRDLLMISKIFNYFSVYVFLQRPFRFIPDFSWFCICSFILFRWYKWSVCPQFPFLAKQPKYFIYFKNFIVARFLFIYTTNHNHAVNFKMGSHVFSDLYNTFLMQNMLLRLLVN